ncbi:MAG TPA: hypothetical protein VH415_01100 [Nitrososphaeraceae archaeon]|jgi:hypothetical protein
MVNYFNAVHAFRQLTKSDDKGQKFGKISKSLNAIHTTREDLDYSSAEIIDIENDAPELFSNYPITIQSGMKKNEWN